VKRIYCQQLQWFRLFIVLAGMFMSGLGLLSCTNESLPKKTEKISIGTAPLESSALIYIAESRGFFTDQGLNVVIREYETGAASLNGLLKGETDIATPAEYALVGKALQKEKARAVASIAKAQYFYLIGRKDRGILKVDDLNGKKIGVVRKTIAEFYLGRFIDLNGLDERQITPVNTDISKSEELILGGGVDAIMSRTPYVFSIEEKLGSNAVIWPAQSEQALYAILVGKEDWIIKNPQTIKRLLNSLVQAEKYLIRNPADAKAILQNRLGFDDSYMEAVWSRNQFALSLDQSLIIAMEDQARWMIKSNLAPATGIPDFLEYVYEDSLKEVKPEAVNIIR
jgi:ABC-type nitrate/sulfonate/bicarbonate transport system substrate-binding protein